VVDRIAVVVGDQVITESEVRREVRLTAFLNGAAVDLSADSRRAAAERLVDQQLIRNEMQVAGYRPPSPEQGAKVLADFRRANYPNEAAYRAVLAKDGITEDELKDHLLWQAAALAFTEQRFRMLAPPATESANRVTDPAAQGSGAGGSAPVDTEDQMDAWLRQARSATRIQFKKGAFQ
jgi:hypothetical protein